MVAKRARHTRCTKRYKNALEFSTAAVDPSVLSRFAGWPEVCFNRLNMFLYFGI